MPPTISGNLARQFRLSGQFRFVPAIMKSPVIKHSIVVAGRRTAVSLEDAFWEGLREIAKERNETLKDLVTRINADRQMFNLSSAIRVFVLKHYRDQVDKQVGSPGLEPSNLIEDRS
jgi:predicted DNA-binding ribbon-helix-helix protein